MATNGQERTAAEITADVVKKNGLDLAQDIRALAERARKEGEALASYAEETANHIIQASEQAAARIAGYLERTAEARESVQGHSDKLTDLPEKSEIVTLPASVNLLQHIEQAIAPGEMVYSKTRI